MLNHQLLRQQQHHQSFKSLISDNFNFNNNNNDSLLNSGQSTNSSMPSISTFNNQYHQTAKTNNETNNEPHSVMSNNNYYINALLQHQQQHQQQQQQQQQQQNNDHDSTKVYSSKQVLPSSLPNQMNNGTYSYHITNNSSPSNHQQSNPIYVQADQSTFSQLQPAFSVKDRYFVPLYCGICRAYGCQCFYGAGGGTTSSTGPTTNFNGKTLSEHENVSKNHNNNTVG